MRLKNISLTAFSFAGILSMGSVEGVTEKNEKDNPHVNVETIGHLDHGKTTLTTTMLEKFDKKFGHKRGIFHEGELTIVKAVDPRKDAFIDRNRGTVTFPDPKYAFETISKLVSQKGSEDFGVTISVKEKTADPILMNLIKMQRSQKTQEGHVVFVDLELRDALSILSGYAAYAGQYQDPETKLSDRPMVVTVSAGNRFQDLIGYYDRNQDNAEPEDLTRYILGLENYEEPVDATAYDFDMGAKIDGERGKP